MEPGYKPHVTGSKPQLLILCHADFEMVDANLDVKVLAFCLNRQFLLSSSTASKRVDQTTNQKAHVFSKGS